MDKKVIKEHFWKTGVDGDVRLTTDELGWPDMLKEGALSDYPETIFRHCVEIVGFNLLFYWTRDENFYAIETEKSHTFMRERQSGSKPHFCQCNMLYACRTAKKYRRTGHLRGAKVLR